MAVRLECDIKNYHWGKLGTDSAVAQLAKNNKQGFTAEEKQSYAELWMGTLPAGPSVIVPSRILLSDHISKNPACLGNTITTKFNEKLPFLFKVLSVNQSLSIQAHPNKKHAEELHGRFPDRYKDANHKPEMALALTDFEGLCSFMPFDQIQKYIKGIPELGTVIGPEAAEMAANACLDDEQSSRSAIKTVFSQLMRCDPSTISQQVDSLVQRLQSAPDELIGADLTELVIRLNSQFPGDVGVFSTFFLNHMRLKPGEAMFLAANVPHAYLYGDCVECMATSDNVVRAGLTPKFKDVDTLVDMLDYSPRPAESNIMAPSVREDDSSVTVFKPPVPDFGVHKITVAGKSDYKLTVEDSASIILVTKGEGLATPLGELRPGHVIFLPANEEMRVRTDSDMMMYRALCLP